MRILCRSLVVALLLMVGMVVGRGWALAHADLVRSDPKPNAVLSEAPPLVQLWFSEAVELRSGRILVHDAAGKRVDRGSIAAPPGDARSIKVDLEQIGPGKYSVDWLVMSAVDGHVTRGFFVFSVKGETAAGAPSSPEVTGSVAPSAPSSEVAGSSAPPSPLEVLTRWASLLAGAVLLAGFALALIARRPSAREWSAGSLVSSLALFGRGLRANMVLALAVLAAAAPAALLIQAASLGDLSVSGLWLLLGSTRFGLVWLARAALMVGLASLLYLWKGEGRGWRPWGGLALGTALLLTFSLNSHAAALAEEGPLPLLSDWLHLLAASAWLGSLVLLARVLFPMVRASKQEDQASLGAAVLLPFSRLATFSVSTLLLTGLYSAWLELGPLDSLFTTPYGAALLVKLGLSLPMLLLAVFNFRRVSKLGGNAQPAEGLPAPWAIWWEAVLGTVIFMAVAVLVSLPPARAADAASTGSGALFLALTVVLLGVFMVGLGWWAKGPFAAALERSLARSGDAPGQEVGRATEKGEWRARPRDPDTIAVSGRNEHLPERDQRPLR